MNYRIRLSIRPIFVAILCLCCDMASFCQNARGYFFKDGTTATLEYYTEDRRFRAKEEFLMNDSLQILKRTYSDMSEQDVRLPDWKTISETTYKLSYTSYGICSVTDSQDKITLLALPLENGPRIWEDKDGGSRITCRAEWAYVVDTYSFDEEVIKITRSVEGSGVIQCSYWAYSLGKIWSTVTSNNNTRTVSQRTGFGEFREVPKKEFNKIKTNSEFKKSHIGIVHSYRADNPDGYALLQKTLDNYVLTLNGADIIYYTGKGKKANDWTYWLDDSKDWPEFQIKYTFEISVKNNDISCTNSFENTYQNRKEVHADNEITAEDRVTKALSGIKNNPKLRPSFEIEPNTNYAYYYEMKDTIESTVNISSYRFKVQKTKNSFEVKSGDLDVWKKCESSIQGELRKLFRQKNSNNIVIRIIKFSSGQNERYSLVTMCAVLGHDQHLMHCYLYNTD